MVIMPLQALLAILMVFCVRNFLINCSINDRMFEPISTVKVIMEKDINADKIPVNNVAGCSGYSFQNSVTITGLINKTNGFMEHPSKDNATFTVFTIKLGNEDTFFATLTGINGKKLDYGSSAKYRINLLFSKRDGHKENSFQMIAEGAPIAFICFDQSLNKKYFLSKDVFLANQNFVTNRFEFWASLRNLACNHAEATEQRLSGIEASETCKYKSGDIKNNPKSDYAKACKTYDDDDEFGKHGIEFRIYATRIDFKRLEEEYWVEFGVNVEIGFSFSTKIIEFSKAIKVTGKIGTLDRPEPYLDILNRTENYIKLFSIQLGNNGRNFAILTDEMNGNVYDYGSSVIANLEHKSIQEIIEEDGAIATIGPDMNLEGKLMFATNFEFLSVSKKVCTGTGDLKLNSELIEKELSCVSI
uniref:Galectin n=1 Tax=Meloidogyne floridensis TaxID=298350 RepID=A0A915PA15_9BILA